TAFIDRYINPANAADVPHSYTSELAQWLNARNGTSLAPNQAYDAFVALTPDQRQPFIDQVFFDELRSISPNPNSAVVQTPERAYAAIGTLFPPSSGYTDNLSTPPVHAESGRFNMLNAIVATDYNSNIDIIGPGGSTIIGPLNTVPGLPINQQGLFTFRGGS